MWDKVKHANLPICVLKDIQMEGWHEYNDLYIDMDDSGSAVFPRLHRSRSADLSGSGHRLGLVHRPTHDHRHRALCRSEGPACSRCLPPLLARRPLGHEYLVEAPDGPAGSDLRLGGPHRAGPGRHPLSPLGTKDLWGLLVARCGSMNPEAHRLCLGLEPRGPDPAGISSLGRRTAGAADPDAAASQRGRFADRVGPSDAPATGRLAAAEVLSAARRRVLRHIGRLPRASRSGPHSPDQSDATRCGDLRALAQDPAQERPTGPSSDQGASAADSRADGPPRPRVAVGHHNGTGQGQETFGPRPPGALVSRLEDAGAVGDQPRPRRQRTRRFLLHHRRVADRRASDRRIRRSLEYRGHVQKHQTIRGRPRAADLEGPGAGTSRHAESVAGFGGLAVVSPTAETHPPGHRAGLVSGQNAPEFPGCVGGVAAASVDPTNKSDVRQIARTYPKSRGPHRSPIQGCINLHKKCESSLYTNTLKPCEICGLAPRPGFRYMLRDENMQITT